MQIIRFISSKQRYDTYLNHGYTWQWRRAGRKHKQPGVSRTRHSGANKCRLGFETDSHASPEETQEGRLLGYDSFNQFGHGGL